MTMKKHVAMTTKVVDFTFLGKLLWKKNIWELS